MVDEVTMAEKQTPCGCRSVCEIDVDGKVEPLKPRLCPMHAAAPKMLAACAWAANSAHNPLTCGQSTTPPYAPCSCHVGAAEAAIAEATAS